MDKVCIRRLEVFAHHGVYAEENRLGQKFYVSVEMEVDTRLAGIKDDLTESVNYGQVCQELVTLMQSRRCKLIEAAAENIARYLLLNYSLITGVKVDIEKPSAPVPYPLDTVAVSIYRTRHSAFIATGSNVGDRKQNILAALMLLEETPDVSIINSSSLYETKAYGFTEQPDFLNGCVEICTLMTPYELLNRLNAIEEQLGRTRQIHWGPRTIDLDIIFYDDQIIDSKCLTIPHKDMANRVFVLKPLSDIAGYKRHPILNLTVDEMLAKIQKA